MGIKALIEKLESFRSLQKNWDSYGADPPSEATIEAAKAFVGLLRDDDPMPYVVPFADRGVGGVCVCWDKPRHDPYADIEWCNDGTILATILATAMAGKATLYVDFWDVQPGEEPASLKKIKAFLAENGWRA